MSSTDNIERIVRYEADTSQAVRQVDKLTDAVQKNAEQMDSVGKQLESFGNKLDLAGAFYIAKDVIGQVTGAIKGMIDMMDDLGNAAQSVGVDIERLQGIQFAFVGAGISAEQTTKALSRLATELTKLDDPMSNSARLLREMGVTAEDTADTALAKIADAFANSEDGANKTAVAVEIFSKELGTKLVPALNGGSQAINDATAELRQMGIITEEDAKKASEFNANMDKMSMLAKTVGVSIVSDLLPSLNKYLEALLTAIKRQDLFAFSMQSAFNLVGKLSAPVALVGKLNHLFYDTPKEAAEQWDNLKGSMSDSVDAFVASLGKAQGAAEKPVVPNAQLTAMQKWEQQILATGKAAEMVPEKIKYLQAQIKATDASTAEGKSKIEAYEKAVKQLQSTASKSGSGRSRKEQISEFDAWVKSLGRAEEAVGNVDRKVTYLEAALAKLRESGEGSSEWAKKLEAELAKLKPPDAVAQALAKITKELQDQQDVQKVIQGLSKEMENLATAGKDASIYAAAVRQRLLELQAAKDPVAAVTVQVQKLRDELERTDAINRELLKRLMAGDITGEEFDQLYKSATKATDSMDKMDKKAVSLADSIGMQLGRAITDWTDDLIDNMGKAGASVSDFVETTIKQLAKLVLNSYFQQVASAFTGAGGISGLFTSTAAKGAAYDGGVEYMAQGGILNGPTVFHTRRGLAVGGEAGTEAVVPLRRTGSGDLGVAASPVNVEINNYTDASVTATSSASQVDGSQVIKVEIRRQVREALSDGSMDRTLRSNYGLTRQPAMG